MSEKLPPSEDLQQVAAMYHDISSKFLAITEQSIDRARAMQDKENLVKEQIKKEMVKSFRNIFTHCYMATTGKRPENYEQD